MRKFDPERITGYALGGVWTIDCVELTSRFDAARRAKLAHRLLEMAVDSMVRYPERAPDFLRPEALEYQAKALPFAFSQRLSRVIIRGSRHFFRI